MEPNGSPPTTRPRFTPKQLAVVFVAFVLGGIAAILVERAVEDSGPMRAQQTVAQVAGTLSESPAAPLQVISERVRLPADFTSTRYHGGPTFTFVNAGEIEVDVDGDVARYGPGAFFFLPAGQVHTVAVLETAQLAILRLLPPGAEPTTEVG